MIGFQLGPYRGLSGDPIGSLSPEYSGLRETNMRSQFRGRHAAGLTLDEDKLDLQFLDIRLYQLVLDSCQFVLEFEMFQNRYLTYIGNHCIKRRLTPVNDSHLFVHRDNCLLVDCRRAFSLYTIQRGSLAVLDNPIGSPTS